MKKKIIYDGEVWEMDVHTEPDKDNMVRIYKIEHTGRHRWKYVPKRAVGSYNYLWRLRDFILHFFHNRRIK